MTGLSKTILITGAGTGIGRDAAFALAARGHTVVASTLDETQAQALRAEAQKRAQTLDVIKLDITSPDDRRAVADRTIDVLINNAGVGESGSLAEVNVDRIRRTFEVNVFATLELTQLVLKGMLARERGTVLFVSSIAGRLPMAFLMPYGMTKFALSAGGAALREELDLLRKNVHVALIEPGAIHTGFNQAMLARKFAWMERSSYFKDQLAKIKAREDRLFGILEARSTASIVARIVTAAEATRPGLRYVAPWIQGLYVRLARFTGV